MNWKKYWPMILAGFSAGAVNGLFGAGGGMVLVPLLVWLTDLEEQEIFPASVAIILPICVVSLLLSNNWQALTQPNIWLLLVASAGGGILASLLRKKIPTLWLHRILGIFILWGGVRYLW